MHHLSLKLNSIALFILLLAGLVGFTLFTYRRTNPPMPDWLKKILTILRVASLAMILFILFEPVINFSWNRVEKPVVAVLLDTSASMSLADKGEVRSEAAKKILRTDFLLSPDHDHLLECYQFSDQLLPLSVEQLDSVKFNRDGTDITTALKMLKEKNIDRYLTGVVLITDGIHNLGDNPARYVEEFDVPIFPIAIGSAIEQKDIVITKVTTNQVTYADNQVPVDITVQAFGYPGQTITVTLQKGSETVAAKDIVVEKTIFETRVRLSYIPHEPGFQKYQVQVPARSDELTALNNQRNFYTKVLKSKMKVLFLAGSPDPDFKFIKKNLASDVNIELDGWVVKKNQEFYQGNFPNDPNKLKPYDCVILQNFPGKNVAPQVIATLKDAFETYHLPLLFIAGNGVFYPSLLPLQNFLPLVPPYQEAMEMLVIPQLTPEGLIHPITRIVDNEAENQQKWQNMPPVYVNLQRLRLYPGSKTLVEIDPGQVLMRGQQQSYPFIVAQKMGLYKSIAVLGYGIWRWDLLMWGIGKSNEVLNQFLNNCIRWLVTREDTKTVRIYPDQEIYRNGQPITFTGEVYYEDLRPLQGAEVKLQVHDPEKTYEISLSEIGDGKYEGALPALKGGDYSYQGTAMLNNRLLGRDEGQFSVEEFNLEFLQTRMNETLLQQLATRTGGKYFTRDSSSSLGALLQFPSKKIVESREVQLWNKVLLLVTTIVILSIEWFLRKQRGML